MNYPGYRPPQVISPWVFADYYQPQRLRGPVSPVVFQTGVPTVGDPQLDAAFRAVRGEMSGVHLNPGSRGLGCYEGGALGEAADRVTRYNVGTVVEAEFVPYGVASSDAAQVADQVRRLAQGSRLVAPRTVGWGSGEHRGKIHLVGTTRGGEWTPWELLVEMRRIASEAAGERLRVPTIRYHGSTARGGASEMRTGKTGQQTGTSVQSVVDKAQQAASGARTVLDILVANPDSFEEAPAAPAESDNKAVMAVAAVAVAVGVTGLVFISLRRGGDR